MNRRFLPPSHLLLPPHSSSIFIYRAFLRILYAKNEEEITKHGYTPFTLQHAGSVLSAEIEMQVLKTMVGIVGVMLRVYGTELDTDMTILRTGKINYDDESKVAGGMSMLTVSSDDIISEVHRILRTIFRMQSPHVSTAVSNPCISIRCRSMHKHFHIYILSMHTTSPTHPPSHTPCLSCTPFSCTQPSVSATINQRRINAASLAALADEGPSQHFTPPPPLSPMFIHTLSYLKHRLICSLTHIQIHSRNLRSTQSLL